MADNNYELSRRKALLGLGTIGVAGAGAGMGTSALFSDTESFTGNKITAGTMNMTVEAEVVATVSNDYWDNNVNLSGSAIADGDAVEESLVINDAKPGDWLIICFDIVIEDNPGYVRVYAENFVDNENGLTEPEDDVDGSGGDPGPGNGELDEKMLATIWDEYDDSSGNRTGLSTLDTITNVAGGRAASHTWTPSREEGGEVDSDIEYSTVRELYDNWLTPEGFLLGPGPGSDASKIGVNNTLINGSSVTSDGPAADYDGKSFCLLLEIPKEVGNEIQSDSVGLDLIFEAEQVRNNDVPFNGSSAVSNSTDNTTGTGN